METHTLTEDVAAVLNTALDGHGNAVSADGNIVLTISRNDYEFHLGQLYLQVQQTIDQHFPERHEDIRLLFQTDDGELQHIFRLWHPVLK